MVEINNFSSFLIDKKFIKRLAGEILRKESGEKLGLSIAFVPLKEIRKLNKRYKGTDKPTDVLSFNQDPKTDLILGELVICPSQVKKKRKKIRRKL